ncbi:excalibur calcium-binding domain-containing protein [Rhodococcus sp. IEGM 1408]|uniref:excalibur calcium-binding domain-containing protein n=1 Tax=Rhodococcus sp. IEGM 1408 TaxID=3082220 RepID=UPI0029533045|nr:excalibur calcium-binding domain-containing protein [Rhodococcus sp. IEGM 1408]MDV8002761.1 excalibur calcium-binding domain-containing protein [Rhodococcus sp. IEGM 1408]
MPIVLPSIGRPALTKPTYLAPPTWKLVLAWIGLSFGALVALTAAASIGKGLRAVVAMALFGLALALVGGWWLWCESRDRKHADEDHLLDTQAAVAQRSMAGYVAADALAPLTWDTPLTPVARRWPLVGSAAFALFVASLVFMPPAEAAPAPAPAAKPVPTSLPKPIISTVTATTTVPAATTTLTTAVPTPAPARTQAPIRTPAPVPARPVAPAAAPPQLSAWYPNCSAARAAGAAPLRRGEPGYSSKLDRDNDGVACE